MIEHNRYAHICVYMLLINDDSGIHLLEFTVKAAHAPHDRKKKLTQRLILTAYILH